VAAAFHNHISRARVTANARGRSGEGGPPETQSNVGDCVKWAAGMVFNLNGGPKLIEIHADLYSHHSPRRGHVCCKARKR
jgi:hypothetical protein